jgi:ATP-dependent Clp protease ATP-binding subunit ClpC
LQLERFKRTAHAQGLTLEFDDSLVELVAETGYQPEYGARELRRQIRSLVETALASALLRGDAAPGDALRFTYDKTADAVRWEKRRPSAAAPTPARPGPGAAAPH